MPMLRLCSSLQILVSLVCTLIRLRKLTIKPDNMAQYDTRIDLFTTKLLGPMMASLGSQTAGGLRRLPVS